MHEWLSAEQTKDLFCVAAGAGQWRQPWKCLACRQMQRDGACLLNNLPPCHASPRPGLDLTLIVRYYHSPGSGWAQPSAGVGTDLPVAIETTSSHSSNGLAQKYSPKPWACGDWREPAGAQSLAFGKDIRVRPWLGSFQRFAAGSPVSDLPTEGPGASDT
jgi:hypothetical protein